MFVLHGDNDSLVPVEQARRFVATLRQTSTSPVAYAELPGAQHAFEVFRSVRGTHAIRAVARFLEVVYRRRAAER
jgi:acetyl esterase/lipase